MHRMRAADRGFARFRQAEITHLARAHVLGATVDTGHLSRLDAKAEFGGDHHGIAAALERNAEQFLVDVRAVDLRGIEKGHAQIDRAVDGRDRFGNASGARLLPFHELDTIAERIEHEHVLAASERLRFDHFEPLLPAALEDGRQFSDQQGRMGLARGAKRLIDTQMDLDPIALEPAAGAPGQLLRPANLRHAEGVAIERACALLAARGHRQQHMIDANDGHGTPLAKLMESCS
jgi:hypothetical protein